MPSEIELATSAVNADIDSLYAIIGFTSSSELGVAPEEQTQLVEIGIAWLEANREKICSLICSQTSTKKIAEALKSDEVTACLTIADILSPFFHSIPVYVLSALILKITLTRICNDSKR